MKRNSGMIHILPVLIIGLVLILGVVFMVFRGGVLRKEEQNDKNEASQIDINSKLQSKGNAQDLTAESGVSNDTDWILYRDEIIQLEYPEVWEIDKNDPSSVTFSYKNLDLLSIQYLPNSHDDLSEHFGMQKGQAIDEVVGSYSGLLVYQYPKDNKSEIVFLTPDESEIVSFTYFSKVRGVDLFEDIISKFSFIDKSLYWREYKSQQQELSFRYPTRFKVFENYDPGRGLGEGIFIGGHINAIGPHRYIQIKPVKKDEVEHLLSIDVGENLVLEETPIKSTATRLSNRRLGGFETFSYEIDRVWERPSPIRKYILDRDGRNYVEINLTYSNFEEGSSDNTDYMNIFDEILKSMEFNNE